MLQGRKSRRVIAATLLTIMLTNTLAPTVTYALTSGPTAPEATSFEPVDTTDMVNLQTGDFTYNIPLLEVPGPEGGYPLSLSYHAGIQPNEDASWVGLGWTLNPGAINRNVNGYPDDYKGVNYTQRSYWEGGFSQGVSIGVNVGITGTPASVSFGLSFSQDTYQGFGIGASLGLGFSFSPFDASIGITVGPYGEGGISAGVNLNASTYKPTQGDAMALSGSIGLNTNFQSVSVSGGVSVDAHWHNSAGKPISHEMLGISLSSSAAKPSLSVGGGSAGVYNGKAGNISTESGGFGIPIPIVPGVFGISLGYNYSRYWSDETVNIDTYGTLYTNGQDPSDFNKAFDSYSLLDYPDKNIVDNADPTKLQGGAFPEYDNYSVLGQGISGNIRPYLFQGKMAGQSKKNSDGVALVKYYGGGGASTINHVMPQFRFVNDFSNKYIQPNDNFSTETGLINASLPFGQAQTGAGGFDNAKQKLAGSRNIEFFTNRQIKDEATARNNGFIEPSNCLGFERKTASSRTFDLFIPENQYGGIPAGCTAQTLRYTPGQGRLLRVTCVETAYADQIGGFSITNESGVTYHYGLPVYSYGEVVFSEKVNGSTSNGGYASNILNKSKPYAYAWLLTSVTGPDFIDRNNDGKAGMDDWGYWVNFEYGMWTDNYIWRNPSEGYHRDIDSKFRNFSMGKKELYYLNAIKTRTHTALLEKDVRTDARGESDNIFDYNESEAKYTSPGYIDYLKKVLRLDKVYLFNNADVAQVNPAAGTIPEISTTSYANNIVDKYDVDAASRAAIESKAIRVIDFGYDYSLCPGTPNGGKLTLSYLQMRGKGGASTIPPTAFNYELSADEQKKGTITIASGGSFSSSVPLSEGDLLITYDGTRELLGLVCSTTLGALVLKGRYITGKTYTFRTTKNPPYNKDGYDAWGLYKGDFNADAANANENLGRKTSPASAKATDVWSLRSIVTGLGAEIKIGYEPDAYSKVVLQNSATAIIKMFNYDAANKLLTLSIQDDYNVLPPLSSLFIQGDRLNFLALQNVTEWHNPDVECDVMKYQRPVDLRKYGGLEIHSINDIDKTVTVKLESLQIPGEPVLSSCGGHEGSYGDFTVGNVFLKNSITNYGGGLRVKSLAIQTQDFTRTTVYKYESMAKPGISSGVTSYEPNVLEIAPALPTYVEKEYKAKLYSDINYLLTISRIAPSPGVIYESVTVQNKVKNSGDSERDVEGKTEYQFEVFSPDMIYRKTLKSSQNGTDYAKNISFRSSVARIGNLKRVTRYDNLSKKLSETSSVYLHDDIAALSSDDFYPAYELKLANYDYQGLIKERYSEVKEVKQNDNSTYDAKATMSSWEEYPNVAISNTTKDYLTGNTVVSTNLAFDFYSGAVTKKLDIDAYGNRFVTETKPAYTVYSAMGLKQNGGRNMLTQVAGNYVYRVDGSNASMGLVSASVTTWSNTTPVIDVDGNSQSQSTVWRMQSNYNWMPVNKTTDGLTPQNSFVDFNWANAGISDTRWKKTSEITLYDVYSKALEAKDINNNYLATRMDYGSKRVLVSGGPAGYYEIAYSGAEDEGINQLNNAFVKKVDGVVVATVAHTGGKSLKLGVSGAKGFVYTVSTNKLEAGRNYIISAWVKPVSNGVSDVRLYYDVNGVVKNNPISSGSSTKTAGGWSLVNMVINGSDIVPGATLTVGCRNDATAVEAYVDDFRFQPLNAGTSAYVYDAFSGELTHVLDNNNLYTKYEYDATGRLVRTYREKVGYGMVKTNEYQYNYGRGVRVYGNKEQKKDFTKDDCPSAKVPETITYLVPENTFFSAISQEDADKRALDEVYAKGQYEANQKALCWIYNDPLSVTYNDVCPCGKVGSVYYEIPRGKYRDLENKNVVDQLALNDLAAHNQSWAESYAATHPEICKSNGTASLILISNWERPVTPYPITVSLIDSKNNTCNTYTFPAANSGSITVQVPAGSFELKFAVPSAWSTFPGMNYSLSPTGGYTSNPNGEISGGFQAGGIYTLTVTGIQ